jgi:uncharacterized damage-inducible protein DinB
MDTTELLQTYAAGPRILREAVQGLSREALVARPIPGKWTTLEVVCHIADFEPIYADRMKRVIAEDRPAIMSGDPDLFAAKLAYQERDIDEELAIIENVRKQMVRILQRATPADFARTGVHSTDGPITLQELLRRITNHIPHHVQFIAEKRRALK